MRKEWGTHGNEQIRHKLLVLGPGLAILESATLDISVCAMYDHTGKEDGVEPWKGTAETGDQAPCQSEVGVTGVVNLAGISVPSINKDRIAGFGLDCARVLDGLPWELGEGLSLGKSSTLLRTEAILLRVRGIPDPVHEQVGGEESDQEWDSEGVIVDGIQMVGHIESAVAIAQRHTGQVPENQHEAPFLIVHVPEKLEGPTTKPMGTHQVVVMHSSPLEQALAYKK